MGARRWAIAIVAVVMVVFVASRDGSGDTDATDSPADSPAASTRPTTPSPAERPALAKPQRSSKRASTPRGGIHDPMWGQTAPVLTNVLDAYLASSIYPPQSRPLGRFNDDLLNPNQRHEPFRPVPGTELRVRFTADRYFVHGAETLTSTLEVRRGRDPVPVSINAAFIAPYTPGVVPPKDTRRALDFRARGSLYVNQARPAAQPGVDGTALLGVYIELVADSGSPIRSMFTIHVTPASAAPARFTGEFRDRVRDGSLVVEVGIEVSQPGYFLLDCNLYDRDDNPVAWTRFKGNLSAGRHMVPLTFFGKVLVDSKSTAPWHIGQLRGSRFVENREPDLDIIAMYDGTHHTAPYQLTDFSDEAYDSPEKRAKIERLRRFRAQGDTR